MQAVILAGGFGTRLRPLTATRPKPLVPILGKPVLSYLLELLYANGILEVTLTLGYQPQQIEAFLKEHTPHGMHIHTIIEQEPLGTAGGVRAAMENVKEPFFVLSGDCICDFNLKAAAAYHKAQGASVTLLTKAMADPREYGLVHADAEGRVERFSEKPDWSGVSTSFINTGTYILNPEVLSKIPKTGAFDFSKDLFPLLMRENKPLYAYKENGYWCDIGDLFSYRQCQQDILEGKTAFRLPCLADGIYAEGDLPQGEYTLLPPVFIGEHVTIENGAKIGPNTVLCRGSSVGKLSKVRGSVLLEGARTAENTKLCGAVLAEHAKVEYGARLFEDTVVGAESVIDAHAVIEPHVKIWPKKTVEEGSVICENIKYGAKKRGLFEESGMLGTWGAPLEPAKLANLGRAIYAAFLHQKIGIAYAPHPLCASAFCILSGAMTASGASVWNFGEAFLSEMTFFTGFCTFPLSLFLEEQKGKLRIRLFAAGGLPLSRSKEREIEKYYQNAEYPPVSVKDCGELTQMQSLEAMYVKALVQEAGVPLLSQSVRVQCDNSAVQQLLSDCLYRAKAKEGDELTLKLTADGTRVSAFHRATGWVPYEKLLALSCLLDFSAGEDVSVPLDAPYMLDALAKDSGRALLRYLGTPNDKSDEAARELAKKQLCYRDALLLSMHLLGAIQRSGKDFPTLLEKVPAFYDRELTISIAFSPTELLTKLEGYKANPEKEGVLVTSKHGHALLIPSKSGKRLRILAESHRYEFSKELLGSLKETLTKD